MCALGVCEATLILMLYFYLLVFVLVRFIMGPLTPLVPLVGSLIGYGLQLAEGLNEARELEERKRRYIEDIEERRRRKRYLRMLEELEDERVRLEIMDRAMERGYARYLEYIRSNRTVDAE